MNGRRWCARFAWYRFLPHRGARASPLLLLLLGCLRPVVTPPPVPHLLRADTVRVGRQRCVFLTFRDGTHGLTPEQPQPCIAAFYRWAANLP